MNEVEIMKRLKEVAGFFEIYHKTSFTGYRNTGSGKTQEVSVDILDAGPEAGDSRYSCCATSDDGKTASGNPGASIDLVLATVHWYNLDK